MDLSIDQDKIKPLIAQFPAGQIKSDETKPFIQQMRKQLTEQALQSEMGAHFGYDRYEYFLRFYSILSKFKHIIPNFS